MRLCSLLITLCALSSVYCQSNEPVTASSLVQKDARRPGFIQYSLNLLVKLDHTLTLKTLEKWKMIFWILGQYKSKSMAVQETDRTSLDKLIIFNAVELEIRNSTIRTQFMCSPTEQACNTLTVPSFGINYLGTYSNQAQIESAFNNAFVDFNISAYIGQLAFKCDSADCGYDKSSRLLSVVSDKKLTLECSVVIVQNSVYTPAAQLVIWSDMNQFDECPGETNIQKIAQSDTHLYLNTTSDIDIHLYKLSKRCDRTFGKEDVGKSYKCELKPVNQSVPAEMQNLNVLESLSNRIDVHYGPEYTQSANQQFNKTLIAGQTVSAYFTCPFESNPAPVYEWRLKHVVYNQTDSASKRLSLSASEFSPMNKDFSIPKELEVGFYQFQCRAKTEGIINKMSDIITFNLNIIAPPVSSKKDTKTNTGAIIGGVIGGVAALIIIVLLVLFIIRRTKNSGPKDEIEKAKELDIDINDGNPHLSSRTSLTTNTSSKQSQSNGTSGQKTIPGMMVANSTAQSYAAIAHAAAAAAAVNQQRNQFGGNQIDFSSSGSSQNLTKSYNNPGFFETGSYTNQNPLESPPPYDATLHQPTKNQQQPQHMMQQQKEYMGSSTRIMQGANTPQNQNQKNVASLSYTATNQQNFNSTPTALANSLQHLQYTTVQNLARNRNPLNGMSEQMEGQQTQYTTMAQLNPIDV